ncbi:MULTISPECIES: very short patch repair endonuclease [unclassified Brucella]|uniref:very short patch repair endonuclease n=1 Tax=unclassified Brucella TaxID=2632610 RepID=UPI000972BD7F|nr:MULTISPECIES: very short patch repair endonuclease [unclassified Brucella]APX70397.1 very short patch repair endonuclease [Brucella sp. 09RB8471]MRN79735.1 DNA mismatch endonuclease Vsr [Brucella sp. 10RB9210]
MADIVSSDVRSRMMAGIRATNTKPELIVRRALHAGGFRYKLHDRSLPGKPDIVFPRYHAVLFIHGCFWHGHDCHLFRMPTTRPEFWLEKIKRNREVDQRVDEQLSGAGWRIGVVWECSMKGRTRRDLAEIIGFCADWLHGSIPRLEIRGK